MVENVEKSRKVNDMQTRMRRLREALEGLDHGAQTRFAQQIGIGLTTWNAIENGKDVSIRVARAIIARYPGITLDWIYYGKAEGLTVHMYRLLEDDR